MSEPTEMNNIVRAEPGRIRINVKATFAKIIGALSTGPADELERLLGDRHRGFWQFAHDPDQWPTEELALDSGMPPTHLRSVGRGDDAVKGLAAFRFGLSYTDLTLGGRTYTDVRRRIEAVSIIEPVGITVVAYPEFTGLCLGTTDAPTPGLTRRVESYQVPTGHYLIVSTGGWGGRKHHAACQIDRVPNLQELAAIPGSRIDRIHAACDKRHGTWIAERGSLEFRPNSASTKAWDYAKATGHADNRIDCPHTGCSGRVTFTN